MLSSLLVAFLVSRPPDPGASAKAALSSIRRFEQNVGQWPADVRFAARTPRGVLELGDAHARLTLAKSAVTVGLSWGRAGTIAGVDRLPGVSNYLLGADSNGWRTGVAGFSRVRYANVAPQVDLEFYGAATGFEYDLVVRAGGDPSAVPLTFDGITRVREDEHGGLLLATPAGTMRQHKPVAYQEKDGVREPVAVRYEVRGRRIRLRAGAYDRTRPLVIDPTVDFSTYLGGRDEDVATDVATDAAGNIYVTGWTWSPDFPAATLPFPFRTDIQDGFVAKLTPNGTLLYSTYLGGSSIDQGNAIAVSANGSVYVAGITLSQNFPVVAAFQPTNDTAESGFVARLSPDGASLIFSTYLRGSSYDILQDVAIDPAGNAYVAGTTFSFDFPLRNAFQTLPGGGFVTKFTPGGDLAYSTYFGARDATLRAIAVDTSGAAYVVGSVNGPGIPATPGAYRTTPSNAVCVAPGNPPFQFRCPDGVVAKLDASGSVVYATYLRGDNKAAFPAMDLVTGVAVDSAGNAHVLGTTESDAFPITAGAVGAPCGCTAQRMFVATLNASGSDLLFSAVIGSASGNTGATYPRNGFDQEVSAIAVDPLGQTFVAGWTFAKDLPVVSAGGTTFPASTGTTSFDGYVAALSPTGSLVYSTYLAGSGDDIPFGLALAPDGAAVIAGFTFSPDFPVRHAFQPVKAVGYDGFITKLRFPQVLMTVESPAERATTFQPFQLKGWALDRGSAIDGGIDTIHVWAYSSGGVPSFVGAVTPSLARTDVGARFGAQFTNAGFSLTVSGLAPDSYTFAVYPHSSVTNSFASPTVLHAVVAAGERGRVAIESPVNGGITAGGGTLSGWAIDLMSAAGPGISTVHVWAFPNPGSGQAPIFAGVASYGTPRPDIGSRFGPQFANSGFALVLPPLAAGPYLFAAFPYSTQMDSFLAPATTVATVVASRPIGALDAPSNNASVSGSFLVGGWAIDQSAPSGPGVDAIHVWAIPTDGSAPIFLGVAAYGQSRPDVAAIFGTQFTASGYSLMAPALPAGSYDVVAFSHSTVTGTFNFARVARITAR